MKCLKCWRSRPAGSAKPKPIMFSESRWLSEAEANRRDDQKQDNNKK